MVKKSKNITEVDINIKNIESKPTSKLINKVENAEKYTSTLNELQKFIIIVYIKDKNYSTVVLARNEEEALKSFKETNNITPTMKIKVIKG